VSTLYVVASPIGNLEDISPRAQRALSEAQHIVAEDTRRSHKLLSHLGITGKSLSCLDAHASAEAVERVVQKVSAGETVALLTDAGTPSVSDPGAALVRRCHELSLAVVPIPGPSAVTTAIAASGLVEGPFLFAGFLPRSGGKRQRWLERIRNCAEPCVLFEAGNRTQATLADLCEGQPERTACVARELTKKFEQIRSRPLSEWRAGTEEFRGEVTLVLGPVRLDSAPDLDVVDELVRRELAAGQSAKAISESHHRALGMSKRDLYQRVLSTRNERPEAPDEATAPASRPE
jgi:16S rRNA (cytidine1402-2'-O)-methyltransferase